MTVLYIIDTLGLGGAETSLTKITGFFTKVKPVFIHLCDNEHHKNFLLNKGIEVYSLNINNKNDYKTAIRLIKPIIEKVKPDIVHSTLYSSDMIARRLKKYFDFYLINSFVSNSYGRERYADISLIRSLKLRIIQTLDRYSVNKVDLFISNSVTIKNENERALKIKGDKVIVIPRGREFNLYDFSTKEIDVLKTKMGFEGKDVIINVGRLIKSKGQLELIQAFAENAEKFPDAILIIVGEGEFKNQLLDEINRLEMSERIFLLGKRTDIPELLAIAKVFAFTSHLEGMPGSLIEAMMSEKLIVCSDISENKDCLPMNCGLFFETGNVDHLSKQLAISLSCYDNYKEMSIRARNYSIDNYDIVGIAQKYEKVYYDLIGGN